MVTVVVVARALLIKYSFSPAKFQKVPHQSDFEWLLLSQKHSKNKSNVISMTVLRGSIQK
jgi:hypothetical protein